jgi:predicted AAA+ superfamily ATPase
MEILYHRLTDFVGGTLSINAVSEDMQISHKTIAKWIDSLERLYGVFRILPFGPPQIKAIKKERKVYFFDWNSIIEPGRRFENFVAVHLLKWIYFEQDVKGRNLDLRFYRDKAKREVDFVVLENNQPLFFIEAKLNDSEITQGLKYLTAKYPAARAIQVHLFGKKEFQNEMGIEHLHVIKLLEDLV